MADYMYLSAEHRYCIPGPAGAVLFNAHAFEQSLGSKYTIAQMKLHT